MDNVKKQLCQLCFTNESEKRLEDVEDVIKDIPDVMLKLNCHTKDEYVMCTLCCEKLMEVFTFKSMCLNSDSTIISYIEGKEDIQVDLKEIFTNQNANNHTVNMLENVCRLCMKIVSDFMTIGELVIDMIGKLIPEMNLQVTKDPVICKVCSNSLFTNTQFVDNYLGIEEKVKNDCTKGVTDCSPEMFLSESCIKTELDWEESERADVLIEPEFVAIKSEVIEEESSSAFSVSEKEANATVKENRTFPDATENAGTARLRVKRSLNRANHTKTQIYKCHKCSYETKYKHHLKKHEFRHKDPSEVQMHKCDKCEYNTFRKDNLKIHQLTHKDISEVQMYKCSECNFKTKHKKSLKYHELRHKGASEAPIYKCSKCKYETKHKYCLHVHKLKHKDPSEVQMYECYECEYKTVRKGNLKQHQLVHKNTSQARMYKCSKCEYETKHRNCLQYHLLTHRDVSNVQMFKCDECNYETKRKRCLARHALMHKDLEEVLVYECDKCEYKSRHRGNFRSHRSTHKDSSEAQVETTVNVQSDKV